MNSIAKTSAYQLQKTDIRVNSICPGLIETGMTEETFEYARRRGTVAKLGQLNPLARFGVPEGRVFAIAGFHILVNITQKSPKWPSSWLQVSPLPTFTVTTNNMC